MSKKSRRRNRVLAAMVGLAGASKLGLLPTGSKVKSASDVQRVASKARLSGQTVKSGALKAMDKTGAAVKAKVPPGIKVNYKGEVIKKGVNTGVGNLKTKFVNLSPDKGPVGIYQSGKKISDLNQKAINVLSDGKIQTGGKTYANRAAYSAAMKAKRALPKEGGGFKNFMNKFVLGEKTQMKMGKMVKARGGGVARTKPTKLY